MQRFALSLALIAMLGLGLAGTANAADPAGADAGAPKAAAPAAKKSCGKKRACHRGKKKAKAAAPKTESTDTTGTTK
jgi:hypothetical protein